MSWKHLSAVGVVVLAAQLALMPAAAAFADDDPPATPKSICEKAAALIASDAQAAIDLIDDIRSPSWRTEPTCVQARLDALQKLGDAPSDPTFSENVADGWKSFVKKWITPYVAPATVAAAMIVFLIVAARFAVLLRRYRDGSTGWVSTRRGLATGITEIIAGSVLAVIAAVSLSQSWTDDKDAAESIKRWIVILGVVFLVVALVGANHLARYLSSRLRISIEGFDAKGVADPGLTARVLATLGFMGASPTRDLDSPTAPELQALTDAKLPTTGGNQVWSVVTSILVFIFVGTPWRIRIDSDSAKYATLRMRRNGAEINTVDIRTEHLTLKSADPSRSLDAFVAAAIVVNLAEKHQKFEGLTGATSWASIGYQYVASNVLAAGPDRTALLVQAVDLDPKNKLADFLKRNEDDTNDPDLLAGFATWLWDGILSVGTGSPTPVPNLEARFRRVLNAIWTLQAAQAAALVPPGRAPVPPAWRWGNILSLITLVESDARLDGGILLERVQADVAFAFNRMTVDGAFADPTAERASHAWFTRGLTSHDPVIAYNAACYNIAVGDQAAALTCLKFALTIPGIKAYARTDPEMTAFRAANAAVFWDEEREPLDIEPFATHKAKLEEVGIVTIGALAGFELRIPLALHLDMSTLVLARLQANAKFVRDALALGSTISEPRRVEILAAVLDKGVGTAAEIPHAWTVASSAEDWEPNVIAKDLALRFATAPSKTQIKNWLAQLA